MKKLLYISVLYLLMLMFSCQTEPTEEILTDFQLAFNGSIDLENLSNYTDQGTPNYVTKDNTLENHISDEGATLGRVLFYDKKLSASNQISCASCHKQSLAFGDNERLSEGVNGRTARHSMRLVNARYGSGRRFFWDKRAETLEEQATMPIRDHAEMGFSGEDGSPSFEDLLEILSEDSIYPDLFEFVFGSPIITEEKMQNALAQFIRSIESFDSKYDIGRQQVSNSSQAFPNFSASENRGKSLFSRPADFGPGAERIGGGFGCQSCHQAPEFSIAPISRNNGVTAEANGDGNDFEVARSPSLRNLFDASGTFLTPLMHTGTFNTIDMVIDHYNNISADGNIELDNRLKQNGIGQKLNISDTEREDLIAFLKTLSGHDVYENKKWSDPF